MSDQRLPNPRPINDLISIRRAVQSDASVIARHRTEMFRDMGQVPTEALALALLAESQSALATALADGTYAGWLAIDGSGRVVAGAGAHIKPQFPRVSPDGTGVASGAVPLVVNVYTEPEWRRKGVARVLMEALMEWAVQRGCDRILLHASDAGRALYASLGFKPTNEMRWSRPPQEDL
jgi:GNAT superfamily N-acetyltransferase